MKIEFEANGVDISLDVPDGHLKKAQQLLAHPKANQDELLAPIKTEITGKCDIIVLLIIEGQQHPNIVDASQPSDALDASGDFVKALTRVIPLAKSEYTPKVLLTLLRGTSKGRLSWLPSGNTLWKRIMSKEAVLRAHGIEVQREGTKYPVYKFTREGQAESETQPALCNVQERGQA